MANVDSVVIVSGGMDSVTLLHYLVKAQHHQPAVISFRYGQKHIKEIACAQENAALLGCEHHTIIDLTTMQALFQTSALVSPDLAVPSVQAVQGDNQPITYVPNRNMIFLALAAAYAESHDASEVFYGAQKADLYGYWDTTSDFLERINAIFALNRKNAITIQAPFVHMSKAEILRIGLGLGVDYSKTWSCYQGGDRACGICPTCAERLAAFKELGLADPLPYAQKS